jgi:hypothetical protein
MPVWRAEICRLPLVLGEIDFVDHRYPAYYGPEMHAAATAANAGHAPWITLPNGNVCGQTAGIARYCADVANFTPDDPFLAARVDEIIHGCTDFSTGFKSIAMGMFDFTKTPPCIDEANLQKNLDSYTAHIDKWFGHFEKRITENGKTGFTVGNDLTNADIAIERLVDTLCDYYYPEGLI